MSSISKHPEWLQPLFVNMVAAEKPGILEQIRLEVLLEWEESAHALLTEMQVWVDEEATAFTVKTTHVPAFLKGLAVNTRLV